LQWQGPAVQLPSGVRGRRDAALEGPGSMTPSIEEIRDWLVARVSALADVAPGGVDVRAPFTRYGLDSVALIALSADLEKWLGYRFREDPLDAHPTIEALARFLAEQLAEKTAGSEEG